MPSSLFIGMPVYNGEQYLRSALDCLVNQTYTDWTLLIANNCSDDNTLSIANEYATRDSRISVVSHTKNLGAAANFSYVLEHSANRYFMWAAADDLWKENFLEKCIAEFNEFPNVGAVFSNFSSIDKNGVLLHDWPSLKGIFTGSILEQSISYILEPESMGKANMIYSIFSLEAKTELQRLLPAQEMSLAGSDMALVLSVVSKFGCRVVDEYLFMKRDPSIEAPIDLAPKFPYVQTLARKEFSEFCKVAKKVLEGNSNESLLGKILAHRQKTNEQFNELLEKKQQSTFVARIKKKILPAI